MSNAYVTVDYLKSEGWLNITVNTGFDAALRRLLENGSRLIDAITNRHFFALQQTVELDGDGTIDLLLDEDLIAVNTLKTDTNLDRTFDTTWAATDYSLKPYNANPAGGLDNAYPYDEIQVDLDAGSKGAWTRGNRRVQIDGEWGYWRRLKRATETANEAMDATETGLDVDSRADIEAGHTILVDSEQMYVESYSSNTLTVVRGVNGTTAATHLTSAVIDIYVYPEQISQALIIGASQIWKRRSAGFASTIGFPDGSMSVFDRFDPMVRKMLDPFEKFPTGVLSGGGF